MDPTTIKFKVLDDAVREWPFPHHSTNGSAGLDLRAILPTPEIELDPGEVQMIDSGITVWIEDPAYVGILVARSSVATKRSLIMANQVGVIDSDYQGPLKIAVRNVSRFPNSIKHGERIAQLLVMPVQQVSLVEVPDFEANTIRGAGGFGSTGEF